MYAVNTRTLNRNQDYDHAATTAAIIAATAATAAAAAAALPSCTQANCGSGLALSSDPTKAVCLCHVSCLSSLPALPCCNDFELQCSIDNNQDTLTQTKDKNGNKAVLNKPPSELPSCRQESCGSGLALPESPTTAVCLCHASCLQPGKQFVLVLSFSVVFTLWFVY